jgi:membrane protease YdiL (CAAX protease family)
MDLISLLMIATVLLYLGATIYYANLEDIAQDNPLNAVRGTSKRMLYGVLVMQLLFGFFVLQYALAGTLDLPADSGVEVAPISVVGAVLSVILSLATAAFSFGLLTRPGLRQRVRGLLGADASYNPDSNVHLTAVVLLLALLTFVIGQLVVSGGLSGLAQNYADQGVSVPDVLFNQVLWVIAAVLGVGLFLRRTPRQAAERLGLRRPTRQDLGSGVGFGLLFYVAVIAVSMVWALLTSPELLEEQTAASEQIARAFDTLPVALIMSAAIALGEEIFFRGALQPVFGLWLTSIFFALLHTQYTLTPATIVIFIVSLGLGMLRARHSTTAAVIAHFVYNFIQLALVIAAGSLLGAA